jgi:hypothetical protein
VASREGVGLLFAGVNSCYGAPASAMIGSRGRLRGEASCAESREQVGGVGGGSAWP